MRWQSVQELTGGANQQMASNDPMTGGGAGIPASVVPGAMSTGGAGGLGTSPQGVGGGGGYPGGSGGAPSVNPGLTQ